MPLIPICSHFHRSAPYWLHFGHFTYIGNTTDPQTNPRATSGPLSNFFLNGEKGV